MIVSSVPEQAVKLSGHLSFSMKGEECFVKFSPKEHISLSNADRARLDVAAKVAGLSDVRMRHGAALYKSGRLLAVGKNSSRTHGTFIHGYETDYSEHAEVATIRQAKGDLRGAVLYVARVNKSGHETLSKPCDDCARVITEAGIKKVVYTA